MTKQELVNKFNISSQFNTIIKSDYKIPNYKHSYYMLQPKYSVIIDNQVYEYTQSNYFLTESVLKQSKLSLKIAIPEQIDRTKIKSFYTDDTNTLCFGTRLGISWKDKQSFSVLNPLLPKQLSDNDNLFAFRAILEDALFFIQYTMDDFLEDFGYIDNIESIRKGENIYRQCEQTYRKLGLSECSIQELLDNLSELNIE